MENIESNHDIITIKDIVHGLNNGTALTRIDTSEVTVSNSYGTGGQNVKLIQTSTNIIIEYDAGYEIDACLIGSVILKTDTTNDNVFTEVDALIEAVEQASFSFTPFGGYLGVTIDEAIYLNESTNKNNSAAYNKIRDDFRIDSIDFKQSMHNELVDLLNSKKLSTLTDIAQKAKLDAVDFLKQHVQQA